MAVTGKRGGQVAGELTAESAMAILRAGDGPEVQRLFDELHARSETGRSITLPAPTHEWLAEVDQVDDDMVVRFLDLLWEYPRFDPPLMPAQIRDESLEANLRYGSDRSGFHHALIISTLPGPGLETTELLHRLNARGIDGEQETEAAKWLVSYLLDHPETRAATVRSLWWMLERDDLAPVAEFVRPQLEPDEIADIES